MTHDEMAFSEITSSDWQLWLFSGNLNNVLRDKILHASWSILAALFRGYDARPRRRRPGGEGLEDEVEMN